MNDELFLLIRKLTGTLIYRTIIKSQETLEFKLNKQRNAFAFSATINCFEEVKWLVAVTSFGTTNFVFDITDENNSF